MAPVEIVQEEERTNGWLFHAQAVGTDGTLFPIQLSLSWADYNLWSGTGADRPAAVATAVLNFLLSRCPPAELRTRLDASLARRLYEDADGVIPTLI